MRSCMNWLGRNVQWLALGLGILFLCGVLNLYLRHPTTARLGNQEVPAGRVDTVIVNGPIADLKRAMHRYDALPLPAVSNLNADWKASVESHAGSLASAARSTSETIPPAPAPILVHSMRPLPAAHPASVSFFRGVVQAPALGVIGKDAITPCFRVNGAELSRWAKDNFKGVSIPPQLAHSQVLAVSVIRELLQPDGNWKSAGSVGSLGIQRPKDFPGDRAAPAAGFEFALWACANSAQIQRPMFFHVLEGAEPVLPVINAGKLQPFQPMQKFPRPLEPNPDTIDLVNVPDSFNLFVHDDQVQPGQTYRYRLQYKLFNPLYLNEGLSVREVARTFAVTSAMSDATAAITVPPREQFFVKALQGGRARFDLFILDRQNKPVRQEIVAGPGDAIDGTGWTVVDIRSEHSGRELYVMLTDPLGHVVRRTRSSDEADAQYKNLQNRI